MAVLGQVIDDKYEILTLIGRGGMSEVYLARDRRLNKQWAVKEIQKRARDKNNEVVVQSAIAEANMIKQLDHTAIVRIVDIIETPDVIYIIEDYIEGETLNTILDENGAQPQELVIEWAMQNDDSLLKYAAPEIKKNSVKSLLQDGKKIPYAALQRTQSLLIK